MLSIGNKKYRNLQEQVGFNTEQIEKIFDVLDGLAVTDNVVAIADLSDNLNADQLEIVQKSVAFLVYAGQLYIKRSEDASNAYFDIVFTISSSGGVISFNSKEIEVVLATGALSQTTSTNSTYSTSQIDTLVGAKADLTYVDTQLALKADKNSIPYENIKDSSGNNRFIEGNMTINSITGVSVTYARWSLSGSHLLVVIAGTVANGTTWGEGTFSGFGGLPQWIKDKIYPIVGVRVAIQTVPAYASDNSTQDLTFILGKASAENVFINHYGSVTMTQERSFRLSFDLLIDNN